MADRHPQDDPTIPDDEDLWRRINPEWWVRDKDGHKRLTSQAFCDDPEGGPMSVHLSSVARRIGRTAHDILMRFPGYGMASITAGLARENGQGVRPDPTELDPDHGSVVGKKTEGVRRRFRKAAILLVHPA